MSLQKVYTFMCLTVLFLDIPCCAFKK